MNHKINVTKTYIPDRKKLYSRIDKILDSGWLTNNGPFVRELEEALESYLGVRNLVLVSNATCALQLAYKLFSLSGEIITTPFSFIATASSAKWSGLDVVFSDIEPDTFNLCSEKVLKKITEKTTAILPVHVFGNPSNIENFESIAKNNNLRLIFDAAHAFDIKLNGSSILNRGDVSILSFHATKLFHTIEGGALIIKDDELYEMAKKMINFGIVAPGEVELLGINFKMNEFQAAMGLTVLEAIPQIIEGRKKVFEQYNRNFGNKLTRQSWSGSASNNYSYYPILFKNEDELLRVELALKRLNVIPRRYFYPSLDSLSFLYDGEIMRQSRDIASRILCLPIYDSLTMDECDLISSTTLSAIG